MKIEVRNREDWLKVAELGGPVMDPMIVRSGELFLRGASGVANPDDAWSLISKNIYALATFFDRLVLDDRIPIYNYADTFDHEQNFQERTLSYVNQQNDLLIDVQVGYEAYQEVKTAALAELGEVFLDPTRGIQADQADSILKELASSGYAWFPELDDRFEVPDSAEGRLASFVLGGLIFGGYAQLSGADHLIHARRSRLFVSLSLQEGYGTDQSILFGRLGKAFGHLEEIPYTPSFFAMLLRDSSGPLELLHNALKLRDSREVQDYRQWLGSALVDFDVNGHISQSWRNQIEDIAQAVERQIAADTFPALKVKMSVGVAPKLEADVTNSAKGLWGWALNMLPGRRHRKLLARALNAQLGFQAIERRLDTVWRGDAVPI